MTGFVGLDVAPVQQLGSNLKAQSATLNSIVVTISAVVEQLGQQWQGRDAEQFREWWEQQHRPTMHMVCEAINGLGQSALNNAEAQSQASGGTGTPVLASAPLLSGAAGIGAVAAGAVASVAPLASPNVLPGSDRSWQQVRTDYESRGAAMGLGSYAVGGEYQYQCTAWANYRWRELGYGGPLVNGNGFEMAKNAGGSLETPPTAGAMASYGNSSGANHVMIVEEVRPDGHFRVSEMNTGTDYDLGRPEEYRADSWWHRTADGQWARDTGGTQREVTFASFRQK